MKTTCLLSFCLLIFFNLNAQTFPQQKEDVFARLDVSYQNPFETNEGLIPMSKLLGQGPQYPGGEKAMTQFIQEQINYPEIARSHGHEGTVVVEFIIQANGKIAQPTVKRGIGMGCDKAALAVFENMPDWQPAYQGGKAVPVRFITEVKFSLF